MAKTLAVIGLLFAVVCAVVYAVFQSFRWSASSKLDADVERAKKLGIPFTAAELNTGRTLPDVDNAAPLLVRAGTLIERSKEMRLAAQDLDKAVAGAHVDMKAATKAASTLAQPLSIARLSALKSGCDFKRDFDRGPEMNFPELAESKQLLKALSETAVLRGARGDWKGCLSDLQAARKIADFVGDEPVLISMLVQIALQAIVTRDVEICLSLPSADKQAVASLASFSARRSALPDLRRAMIGEIYFQICAIRNLDALGGEKALEVVPGDSEPPKIDWSRWQRSGLPKNPRDRAYLARALEVWIPALSKGGSVQEISAELDRQVEAISDSTDPSQRLNKILFPVFTQAGQAVTRLAAQEAVTEALVSLVAYRQHHRKWPASLDALGRVPHDPFTHGPLHMRIDDGSAVVWSVGPNRTDEGGEMRLESSKDDVSAYYPHSARPRRG